MSMIFAYLNAYVIIAIVSLLVGVVFSQKIKDWIAGVPSNVRTELRKIEAEAIQRVQAAQAQAIASVIAKPVEPPKA